MNTIAATNTPSDNASPWTYEYQAEVRELQPGQTYTAIILVKSMDDGEVNAMWWWNDINSNGEQYNRTFSIEPGCYVIETSLYERDDFNTDVKNATVLSDSREEVVVGTGTCTDGRYVEEVVINNGTEETNTDAEQEADALPGFAFNLSITATVGALIFLNRKRR